MLSFITYKNVPEQVEIVGDSKGIQELIDYLESVKNSKDHMHLIIDSELNPYPISENMSEKTTYAKSVRLEFNESDTWNEIK